ncbi:MAG: threonine synthase, partial [Vulcanimicrobiaceae bacterium]
MQPLCEGCGAAADARALVCERCGELLHFPAPHLDDAPAARARFRARRASDAPLDRSGVWRFRELLPPIAEAQVVTLRENVVAPLELAAAAAAYAEVTRANYLHLGTNPTASFKDAGMTVAISAAKAAGARLALCASTGNTGASMAAYA